MEEKDIIRMLVVVLLKEQRNKERMNERKKENVEKEDEPEYKRINWFIIMQPHAIKNGERMKKKKCNFDEWEN